MKCSAKKHGQKRKYIYEIRSFTHQKFHVDYLAVSLSVDFQLKNPGEILSLYTIFDGRQNHLLSIKIIKILHSTTNCNQQFFVLGVTNKNHLVVIYGSCLQIAFLMHLQLATLLQSFYCTYKVLISLGQ